jgi:sialidase-1
VAAWIVPVLLVYSPPGKATGAVPAGRNDSLEQRSLWVSGQGGYAAYRIPALAVTTKGTVLAFCEGRVNSRNDNGDIDLLMKRSTDGGASWSGSVVIWNNGTNTCGNPCAVVDRQTGAVFLLMTWSRGADSESRIISGTSRDTRRAFVTGSTDDGLTWSSPKEITADVKPGNWTWYATGPGNGIQIARGPHRGRLVVPCDHIEAKTRRYGSHVIYSDDQGTTWQRGGSAPGGRVNECAVAELSDGRLMLNMRSYDRAAPTRQVALSSDGGLTWSEQHHDSVLVEPVCQASLIRYPWAAGGDTGVLLFSNPASAKRRENLTVRLSKDDGRSWSTARSLHRGPAAYSCLAVLGRGRIGCLYEAGEKGPYETLVFARFSLRWLAR